MAENGKSGTIRICPNGDVTVVTFLQPRLLDAININEVGAELMDLVEKQKCSKIVLDFSNVEYLSSGVLGKLIALYKRARENQGTVALCGICDSILDIFKITRLDTILHIFGNEYEAVAALDRRTVGASR